MSFFTKTISRLVLAASFALLIAPVAVCAQQEAAAPAGTPAAASAGAGANTATQKLQTDIVSPDNDYDENISYIYERPTLQKLSQLYWALSKNDIKNNEHIDNFLMINECDIYRDYYNNEFEWKGIREAGRKFIDENKSRFPLRFELIQPLKLGEYDLQKDTFEIQPDYQINGIRRFEVLADDFDEPVCGFDMMQKRNITGYPRGILIELSRPVTMKQVKVEPDLAKAYIDDKLKIFRALNAKEQTKANLYDIRDAYLVMKVKFFAYQQDINSNQGGTTLAEVLGILEGIEVYADSKKKKLLFSEDYRRKKSSTRTMEKTSEIPGGPGLLLLDDNDNTGVGTLQNKTTP